MTVKEVLAQLESLGDQKRREHNARTGPDGVAGAGDNQFGVKLGDVRKVAKKIKTDHELALKLWETGNLEARLVATLIIDPASLSAKELETLVRSVACAQVADWLNAYVVAKHPEKDALRQKWMKAGDPWLARAGWNLASSKINKGATNRGRKGAAGAAPDEDGLDPAALLDRIEKEMPKARPEAQWTMNYTLAAIGIKHAKHRKRAIAIGEKIGLYKDYPVPRGCTSPYAPLWVEAMVKGKG